MTPTDSDWSERPDFAVLHPLLKGAECVLFDFDGPLCRLFANHPAPKVGARLKALVRARGHELCPPDATDDPHEVLRALAAPGSGARPALVAEINAALTAEEITAARSAGATPHAEGLVRDLVGMGVRIAITTNNAPAAAREYLNSSGLAGLFGPYVFGREAERVEEMKPSPDCLDRAMRALDMLPDACLMLGDSPSDVNAAKSANVRFIGYARTPHKATVLRAADADVVVSSLGYLREALYTTPR
ncbi:HAD family hydrolase [Wenjunlia tyrosinilytica]|uniref:Hydrolase n=1 Tax=Wenjunlia tyrosinilytica TaxID=1544741 RepID=A0A917ZMJ0_9ACTN|nr:HAD family phosphatase [Wenjunlia tyrosinilytica]GGO87243.1 hydrolase [Wenjunlia tyrosinilytica]